MNKTKKAILSITSKYHISLDDTEGENFTKGEEYKLFKRDGGLVITCNKGYEHDATESFINDCFTINFNKYL